MRAGVFVLKSIVKILIKPPIKLFLSLFSPISSLNLSKIGWNMSSNNVMAPSVKSPPCVGSSKSSLISVTILLTISVFASSMLSPFLSFLFFVSPIFFSLALLEIFRTIYSLHFLLLALVFSYNISLSVKYELLTPLRPKFLNDIRGQIWIFNTLRTKK